MACQGGRSETAGRRTACRDATASRAVPRAEPAVITPPDPAFELIPAGHQFCLVQVVLMLGWVLNGMTLRGSCSILAWMQEMNVDWGFDFPVPAFHNRALLAFAVGSLQPASAQGARERLDLDHRPLEPDRPGEMPGDSGRAVRNCLRRAKTSLSASARWNRSNWSQSRCRTRRWSTGNFSKTPGMGCSESFRAQP